MTHIAGLSRHFPARELRRPASGPPTRPGTPNPGTDQLERPDSAIKCRSCNHRVTSEELRLEMSGRHGHRVTNPHGIEFVIGCFSQASGCLAAGQPYRLRSWFAGYQWQIALCRHCGAHLGWYFSQGEHHSFYALILNRVTD